jgi:fused signal recognition particle receptor
MGRSWRSFFRRSKQIEETPEAVVEAPELGAVEGPVPPEDVSAEPVLTVSAEAEEAMVAAPEVETAVDETAVEEPPVVVEPVALREASAGAASSEAPAMTDETVEEESGGWFGRLREGLRRSRESFVGQLNAAVAEFRDAEDEEFWERVEEILITSDVGVPTTAKLVAELEQEALERSITNAGELRELMIEHATRLLEKPVELDISHKPTVILMVGVNGTGKTTNIGKLVHFLPGRVMLAAGDTFRAAAIEQLQRWGERTGAKVIASERGADAAAVVHDAVEAAKRDGTDILLIDTAGRLHTKMNLMAELDKVRRVIERQTPGAPHEVLLTVDATTGQNGLRQAKLFHEVAGVTGIILTKLDGTAKGGIALAIADEVGVPIKLISVGEQIGDLHPFEAREFAEALFGER